MLDRALFLSSPEQFIERHGEQLRSLLGESLQTSWIAWDADEGEWWADEAVILRVGDRQLEIVCFQLDQLALTWGEISTDQAPMHVADWGDANLLWRENGHEVFSNALGGVLRSINVLECLSRTKPEGQDEWHEAWLLGGLEFEFSSGIVRVVNALDENGLESEPDAGPDLRRIPV